MHHCTALLMIKLLILFESKVGDSGAFGVCWQ
jgi:hypothetical protein